MTLKEKILFHQTTFPVDDVGDNPHERRCSYRFYRARLALSGAKLVSRTCASPQERFAIFYEPAIAAVTPFVVHKLPEIAARFAPLLDARESHGEVPRQRRKHMDRSGPDAALDGCSDQGW